MNFKEALKHITGEKRQKRAAQWIERFKLPLQVPEKPLAFHPHAQRNAFRRPGVRFLGWSWMTADEANLMHKPVMASL
jgi:hypothetical protein